MMKLNAEQTVHLVAQYLAAFGINYVNPNKDDSHTNLGFDPISKTLTTRSFGENNCRLFFEYESFSLKLVSIDHSYVLPLEGKTHVNILNWIVEKLLKMGVEKNFDYSFHYENPYAIADDQEFKAPATYEIAALISLRTLAQKSISEFMSNNGIEAEIRIWPHHFDSGAFFTVEEGIDRQMGIGLAIADDIMPEPYFYAAAYDQNGAISVAEFKDLSQGSWIMNGFLKAQCLKALI